MKKYGLYIKTKRTPDRTSPYTNTDIYTYHHLLATFNEQPKHLSSKLRLVFRIIHGSHPTDDTRYPDVFPFTFFLFRGENRYGTMKQNNVLFPVYLYNNIL
jgi:hypothetical protein